MDLRGKVAIVTGSGGPGCGRAEALRLAAAGCLTVVSDIDEAGGQETLRLIAAEGGHAAFRRCDVRRREDVGALVGFAEKTFGGLDILVNNASAPYRPNRPMEEWYDTVETDLLGAMYGVEFGAPAMRRRGGGSILNVGSTSALGHGPGHTGAPAYDVAKIGVTRLTTALTGLNETDRIRVNCLVPDWVATPEVKAYYDALTPEERQNPRIPPVLISLEEIAGIVVRIVADDSLFGRVVVWWCGQNPGLIPITDSGYGRLETYIAAAAGGT